MIEPQDYFCRDKEMLNQMLGQNHPRIKVLEENPVRTSLDLQQQA